MATFQKFNPTAVHQPVPGINTHPEYDFSLDEWEMIRDVLGGSRHVKARGERYLPRLHEQDDQDYANYRDRALFFNGTKRTATAMVGLLLRKTPEFKLSAEVEKLTKDTDLRGTTLGDYIKEVAENVCGIGRCGTFIDWSSAESRPYLSFYRAEDIIDWEEKRVDGRMRLTALTLREITWEHDDKSGAANPTRTHVAVQTFRKYRLVDGILEVVEARSIDNGTVEEKPIEIKHRGKALSFIPFIFHTPAGNRSEVSPSPLADIAEINVSHYRTSADLENGRHMAGLPTLYAAGFDAGTKLVVGSSHAWISENTDAKAGFIEFTGQGLTPLKEALTEKQEQMAALGARMLEVKSADAEAFETVQLRSNAEQASLTIISGAISATMSAALQHLAWWFSLPDRSPTDFEDTDHIILSTDFVGMKLSPQALTALTAAYQSAAISSETYFYNLAQGEMFKDDWTLEDERRAIEQTPPTMAPPAPGTAPGTAKPGTAGK